MKTLRALVVIVSVMITTLAVAQQPVNDAQTAGTATLTGNGTTGAGSQRVTIASDNTAFPVNSTLTAETTKVIGTVRTADGAGNLLTTNSTTYTAKFALDSNLLGTLGTAFSTAGKVDVKAADGDVFVRQATGTNLHAVIDSGSTTAVTQATGTNLHAVLDSGTTTVTQATGTNLHVVCDSGCSASTTISLIPAVSGGLLNKHFVAAASDNATAVVSGAHQVYEIHGFNAAAYPVYLKLYNATSSTGCGATGLYKVFGLQAGLPFHAQTPEGWAMGTGISYCLVKGITDADDTSVLLSDAVVDIAYD